MRFREILTTGVIAGLVAFGLAYVGAPIEMARRAAATRPAFEGRVAAMDLRTVDGRISVRSKDGAFARDVELSLVVDGVVRSVVWKAMTAGDAGTTAAATVALDDVSVGCTLGATFDPMLDALSVSLSVDAAGPAHTFALRAELPSEGQSAFVSGVGHVADRASVHGPAVVVEATPHPFGLLSSAGPLSILTVVDDASDPREPMRLSVTSPPFTAPPPSGNAGAGARTDLRFVLGESSQRLWRSLYALAGTPTARVHGKVTGTVERARIFGRDAQGEVQISALADPDGAFDLEVPSHVVSWYAALDDARASAVVPFTPGVKADLLLDVAPGGELKVTIRDPDTNAPVTARLLVRGLDGTVDPNFGPDYRASGAGPVIDAHRGDVVTPLPAGKYRVAATKGIEWSVDAKVVRILPGHTTEIDLAPRHVVPTPGVVDCDLHVHARPSFDTPVSTEDRVLSLVSAGIEFAVPTEHNIVGDYRGAIEALGFNKELASVTGVEVTTYGRAFGHFGVFPYPVDQKVPPYHRTNPNAMFNAVRANDPQHERFFQVHHPRLQKEIAYFDVLGFNPKQPKATMRGRWDFDGIEVFNGYDSEFPERVEAVLGDYWALLNLGNRYVATGSSDSHRVQFHWAGYPRTLVWLDPAQAGDRGDAVDPMAVVGAIKKGHTVVTSGPVLELDVGGMHPGEDVVTTEDPVRGHLRVRAAPWIDVTQVDIVVGGRVVQTYNVLPRPTVVGEEAGTLEEAQARTLRLDVDLEIPIGRENGWVQVIARGTRRMDDVLPFMPVPPFAFTNPIYITRHPSAPASK